MSFVAEKRFSRLGQLTRAEADGQPFDIVKIDELARVLLDNNQESELGRVAIKDAEGIIFYTEVASCTNNKLFL